MSRLESRFSWFRRAAFKNVGTRAGEAANQSARGLHHALHGVQARARALLRTLLRQTTLLQGIGQLQKSIQRFDFTDSNT